MKKILMFVLVLSIAFVFAGCKGEESVELTAPTYVGITIDNTNPENGTGLVTFYKERNEQILVEVTLNNPDNLEIRSVVIDGYYYYYTRFLEESNRSVIYFYMEAGDELAERIYSVDDIQYFDGADVKTTVVSTNNEFKVYVFKDIPVVTRDSYTVTEESISMDVSILDDDSVISADTLIATLYYGSETKDTFVLDEDVSNQSILFSNLDSDEQYTLEITAEYDLDDGQGTQSEVLSRNVFKTLVYQPADAVFSNIYLTDNSITFTVNVLDPDDVILQGQLSILLQNNDQDDIEFVLVNNPDGFSLASIIDNNNVYDLSINSDYEYISYDQTSSTITIGGLLNANEYTIKVMADYDLGTVDEVQTSSIANYTFVTDEQSIPTPVLENIRVEENRILFDIVVNDPNGFILEDSIVANLYIDGELESSNLVENYQAELQIFNVLAGFDFKVEVVASYDLKDGNGVITNQVILEEDLTTLVNQVPEVNVIDLQVSQGYIRADLLIEDSNNTLKGDLRASLIEEGVVQETIELQLDSTQLVFAYPIQYDLEYSIEIRADYNLRDGQTTIYNDVLFKTILASFEPLAPIAEISNLVTDKEGFTFDVRILDADSTIDTDSTYVKISRIGADLETEPAIELSMDNLSEKSFNLEDLGITLFSDSAYKVTVLADYDVSITKDHLQTDQVLFTQTIYTEAKDVPSALVSNPIITKDSITVDIFINNDDDVVVGEPYVVLYKNNTPVTGTQTLLSTFISEGSTFDGLLSDNTYEVKVFASYNLDNNQATVEDYPLGTLSVKTDNKSAPSVDILDIITTPTSISMNIVVSDSDGVITEYFDGQDYVKNIKAVLYDGEEVFEIDGQPYEITLNVGINQNVIFEDIYSNKNYNIQIIADYDLNDDVNVFTDKLLEFDFAKTDQNFLPIGSISDIALEINTISFTTSVYDTSSVITDGLAVYVCEEGQEFTECLTLPVSLGEDVEGQITGLLSNTNYTIYLATNYDLLINGDGPSELIMTSYEITTPTIDLIQVSEVKNSASSVELEIFVEDYFDVLYNNNIEMIVYDKDSNLVATTFYLNSAYASNGVTVDFINFYNNHDYYIEFKANVKDGLGGYTHEVVHTMNLTTASKTLQAIDVSDITITDTSIDAYASILDPDPNDLIVQGSVEMVLYEWNDVTESFDELERIGISQASSSATFNYSTIDGSMYLITIEATVDWNDASMTNNGYITQYVIDQASFVYITQN